MEDMTWKTWNTHEIDSWHAEHWAARDVSEA
jgi:hypothetical protein